MKFNLKFLKTKISVFLSFLFFIQLILFNTNKVAFASVIPTPRITPSVSYTVTGETKVGNIIEIAVNVANASDLYGGSVDFLYDTSLLQVQSITKGNIFGTNTIVTPIGANGKIENGQASFAISLKGNKPGVNSTSGTLAIIKAKVLKEGTIKLNTTNSNADLSLSNNTIRVKLANSNSTPINYLYTNKNIELNNNLTLNLSSNNSSVSLGESITFTASSNLGDNAQYSFYIYIDGAWKSIQGYSSNNTLTYTAPKSDSYIVRAWVRDKNNTSNKIYKDFSFTVIDKLSLDLTSDKPTSSLGEAITFTASSNLGDNAQYAFYVCIDGTWKSIQGYSSNNTLTYTAPKSGSYIVRAWVRDKNNTSNKIYKDFSFTVIDKLSLDLTSDKPTSSLGEAITFTASSNLGDNAQYAFYVCIDGTWKSIQGYSSNNTLTYTAPKSGSYIVRAWVRDKNNTSNKIYKDFSFTVIDKLSLDLTSDKPTSSLGEAITFTASSNLGDNAQYAFYVCIDGTWKSIQGYSSNNTLTYTAPKSGSYIVRAWVRDKNNTSNKIYKDFSFTVIDELSLDLTSDKPTSSLGEAITFTASSNLGDNAQYAFYVCIDGTWKSIQGYSSNNTLTYTAPKSGSYIVRAWVRDKNNTSNKIYKDFSFTVIDELSLDLTSDKPTSSLGEAITFTASSNLGDNAQYAFYVCIDGTWKSIQGYSSNNTLTYTAPKSGSYIVRAWVRDKNNTSNKIYKDLSFIVK